MEKTAEERSDEKKEPMDVYFSVFNYHVNDAKDRALEVLEKYSPTYVEEIRQAEEEGIMTIFQKEPTPASASFAILVAFFVNEDR